MRLGTGGRLLKQRLMLPMIFGMAVAGCGAGGGAGVATHTVSRGTFVNSLTVTGELEAVNAKLISAPPVSWRFGPLKITKIVEDGKQVAEGDLLAEFDKSEVQKALTEAQAELEMAEAELRKAQANQASDIASMETDLKIAGLDLEIAKLELDQAGFKAEIDRKQLELKLENARIDLEKAKQELENKKKVNREEINKLELKASQVQTRLDEARETLAKLTIPAPSPGIAILRKSYMTRNKFQVDDQCYPGWPLIGLPDLSRMKADVEVNEVDIAKVALDQEAVIRMDAFPDTSFEARVTDVATLARNRSRDSKVKVFDVTAEIEGQDDRLMPGMTVSCEIVVERVPDVLFVPLDAVFRQEGKTVAYVRNGRGFDAREVALGSEGNDKAIVKDGLSEGDEVALMDPTLLEGGTGEAARPSAGGAP